MRIWVIQETTHCLQIWLVQYVLYSTGWLENVIGVHHVYRLSSSYSRNILSQ